MIEFLQHVREQAHSQGVINGTAIIRIDHAEIPQLGALIDIRNTRQGQLQHGLDQGVARASSATRVTKGRKLARKLPARDGSSASATKDRVASS